MSHLIDREALPYVDATPESALAARIGTPWLGTVREILRAAPPLVPPSAPATVEPAARPIEGAHEENLRAGVPFEHWDRYPFARPEPPLFHGGLGSRLRSLGAGYCEMTTKKR